MKSDRIPREGQPRIPDANSEARLLEIRREAESKGQVEALGIRPRGAPFPKASPETGYYGIPVLKEPQWTWEIPLYFFVGGAAGSAAVIASFADWLANDQKLAHDARWVATGGAVVSTTLLISDLGMPSRFLNMLRVFKPQSPMSMGAWTLAVFGGASSAALLAQMLENRFGALFPVRVVGNIGQLISSLLGLPFHNYTGVLIGASAIPVWNHNIRTLPIHFGMSGINAGVSIIELMGNEDSRALNFLGFGAAAMETYEGYHLELKRDPRVNRPLKRGTSGWITRTGGVLSGPVPLLLRLLAGSSGSARSRKLRRAAAWSSIAGSLLTRYGWVQAGHASARDWRLPLQIAAQAPAAPKLESKPMIPEMKAAS